MKPLFELANIKKFEPRAGPKVDFHFQALGLELEPIYGKLIWTLPHKPNFTEDKIRKAHEIAKKRGNMTFAYLYGVIKKL